MTSKQAVFFYLLFFLLSWDKDPLIELETLQKKTVDITIKEQETRLQIEKIKSNILAINKEITASKKQIIEYEKIITEFSGYYNQTNNIFYYSLITFDKNQREKYYNKEEFKGILSLAALRIRKRREKLLNKKMVQKKLLQDKENLSEVLKHTLLQLQNQENEQSNIIKKIFSSKKLLKQYMAYKKNSNLSFEKRMNENTNTSFEKNRGNLLFPVEGDIIVSYGENKDISGLDIFSPGIEIKSGYGSPVKAIFFGTVEFTGQIDGYGSVVILKHSGNYYSVYGNCNRLLVQKEETVPTGTVLCITGHPGFQGEYTLYFELRKGKKPINPKKWFSSIKK